jgi:hypothetical protein
MNRTTGKGGERGEGGEGGEGGDGSSLHLRFEVRRLMQEREQILTACAREVERGQDRHEHSRRAAREAQGALETRYGEERGVLVRESEAQAAALGEARARVGELEGQEAERRREGAALRHRLEVGGYLCCLCHCVFGCHTDGGKQDQ